MKLSKKDYDFCNGVYEELRAGVFSKQRVGEAYSIMFGNDKEYIANKKKRAQVFSYFSRDMVTCIDCKKNNDGEIKQKEPTAVGATEEESVQEEQKEDLPTSGGTGQRFDGLVESSGKTTTVGAKKRKAKTRPAKRTAKGRKKTK